ncbi:MAG: response regulator [Nitrospiraceae bacterium]
MLQYQATSIRLLLVDDHEVVRLGLRELFDRSHRIDVVGESGTATHAVTEAVRLKPDVVLMDLRLPDGSGVEACREIRATCPKTQVLFLTSFGDDEAVLSTTFAGASGYVLKEIDGRSLVEAVKVVARGQSILDPAVTGSVLTRMRSFSTSQAENANHALSSQERRILPLIAEGKTNKEIATVLGLSETTVKSYLHNMFQKLQISRRSQAAALFSRRQHT